MTANNNNSSNLQWILPFVLLNALLLVELLVVGLRVDAQTLASKVGVLALVLSNMGHLHDLYLSLWWPFLIY